MNVKEIMTCNVQKIDSYATIGDAAEKMKFFANYSIFSFTEKFIF